MSKSAAQEEREIRLDKKSAPLREAISQAAHQLHAGVLSGWNRERGCWVFELTSTLSGVEVTVAEDGSEACFFMGGALRHTAKTVAGVRRVFTSLPATG